MSRREGRRVAVNRGTRTPVDAISEIPLGVPFGGMSEI